MNNDISKGCPTLLKCMLLTIIRFGFCNILSNQVWGGRGGGIHWFGMKCYIVPFTLLIDGLLNLRQPNSFYNCTIFISAAQTSLQAPQKLQYNGRKKGLVLTGDISLSEVANDGQHIHMNILSTTKPVLGIATACVIKIISIYS